MNPFYYVYVSDRGSAPEAQIASVLAETLADLGYRTVFPSSGLPEHKTETDSTWWSVHMSSSLATAVIANVSSSMQPA